MGILNFSLSILSQFDFDAPQIQPILHAFMRHIGRGHSMKKSEFIIKLGDGYITSINCGNFILAFKMFRLRLDYDLVQHICFMLICMFMLLFFELCMVDI